MGTLTQILKNGAERLEKDVLEFDQVDGTGEPAGRIYIRRGSIACMHDTGFPDADVCCVSLEREHFYVAGKLEVVVNHWVNGNAV